MGARTHHPHSGLTARLRTCRYAVTQQEASHAGDPGDALCRGCTPGASTTQLDPPPGARRLRSDAVGTQSNADGGHHAIVALLIPTRLLRLFGVMSVLLAWIRQWRVSVEQLSGPLDSYLSPSQLVTAVLIQRLLVQLLQATHYDRQQIAHLVGKFHCSESGHFNRRSCLYSCPRYSLRCVRWLIDHVHHAASGAGC